jgi:hypothetical protein
MKNALIDTSALVLVLNDPARRAMLERLVQKQTLRLVVPIAALDELFVKNDPALLGATAVGRASLSTARFAPGDAFFEMLKARPQRFF